jgi:hypothetical protein
MKNITKNIGVICAFSLLLFSCNAPAAKTDKAKGNKTDVFTKVFSTNNLNSQLFTIDSAKDNLITGESGTIVRINKNTFVDEYGDPIQGNIEIELIEALKPIDMVLGNLTTTFDGEPLETGGMIYLDAKAAGKSVSIGSNKLIQLKMPTDSTLLGMSLFEGEINSGVVKWQNPIKLPIAEDMDSLIFESFEKTTNVTYSVDGFENTAKFPAIVDAEVSRIAWEGDGLKINKDSVFKIDKYRVHFYKNEKLQLGVKLFQLKKAKTHLWKTEILTIYFQSKSSVGQILIGL